MSTTANDTRGQLDQFDQLSSANVAEAHEDRDVEKTEGGHDVNEVTYDGNELDPISEAKLTRKYDLYIIPVLGWLYLLAYLDRVNIGNANVASPSISKALGLTPTEFGACVSVVYATYVIFEPVWANLLKIVTPKIMLSASCLVWGAITIATAFTKNYAHLIGIRVVLGLFEAGLFPCISVYIFMTYRREETGRRMSYIFVCLALSGAFGGLIAYGLIRIRSGGLDGWQWLYIVEGIISVATAPLAYFWIPNQIDKAWFLNAEQRVHAAKRMQFNKDHYNPNEEFTWREVGRGLADWKTYISGTIQFSGNITLYGLSTFMPAIIRGMGYSNVNAQLLTVPVYILAATSFLCAAYLSDKHKMRYPALVFAFSSIILGYVVMLAVKKPSGRYGGLFICALGMYIVPGTNISWISNNTANHYKRTTSFGMNQFFGNCAGAVIGQIYTSNQAPRYTKAMSISIGFAAVGLIFTLLNAFLLNMINKRRAEQIAQGAEKQPHLGDQNPHFKYYL